MSLVAELLQPLFSKKIKNSRRRQKKRFSNDMDYGSTARSDICADRLCFLQNQITFLNHTDQQTVALAGTPYCIMSIKDKYNYTMWTFLINDWSVILRENYGARFYPRAP